MTCGSILGQGARISIQLAASYDVRVYPRVGGGTLPAQHRLSTAYGLSPRGRGNRL